MTMLLAIDLFCGLGGWTEGLLAEGYRVVGFDIERHAYGDHSYPAQLVIQDVLTIHGKQFKDASLIVASPPCQEFSYMAMPWSRAKQIEAEYKSGVRDVKKLTALFDACFRIQREACEAAGHHIPMVVENVRGAQKWVGRSRWNFGSYHLWGDVPALMPMTKVVMKFNPDGTAHPPSSWFSISDSQKRGHRSQGNGAPMRSDDDVGAHKNPGFRFDGSRRSFQSESVKTVGHANKRDGYSHTRHLTNQTESDFIKQHGSGPVWFDRGISAHGSKSSSRKAASAMIAKIPFALARHIAAVWKPA
jgi:C-5 cytosine-specific DNA methylase